MTVQLTREKRPIVRITYADGSNCRAVGDEYGTWEIVPFEEHGVGDYEPWIKCLDVTGKTMLRAPARHFIMQYASEESLKRRQVGDELPDRQNPLCDPHPNKEEIPF